MATIECAGIALAVIGLGYAIYDSEKSSDSAQEIADRNSAQLDRLYGDTLAELRDLRADLSGTLDALQLQLLNSAVASSSSALSQLSNFSAQQGQLAQEIARGQIINAATLGINDVLAQSRAILGDDPTLDEFYSVFSSVNYALQTRLMVASQLEAGAIGSDSVRGSIEEAREIMQRVFDEIHESITIGFFLTIAPGTTIPQPVPPPLGSQQNFFSYAIFDDVPVGETFFTSAFETEARGPLGYLEAQEKVARLINEGFFDSVATDKLGFGQNMQGLLDLIEQLDDLSDGIQSGGSGATDTLTGSEGDDFLFGLINDDQLFGFDDPDVLRGDDGNDLLYGGAGPDALIGGVGNDILYGGDDSDALLGGAGNDLISGGTGADTARFNGFRSDYTITGNAAEAGVAGPDGTDTLFSVETLIFDDRTVSLRQAADTTLTAQEAREVAYLYEAGLDRNGNIDLPGLNFWIDVREQGMPVLELALEFLESPEFRDAYGEPLQAESTRYLDNSDFVTQLYTNVLDRGPDAAGFDYWFGLAEDGLDRPKLLYFFAVSQENVNNSPAVATLGEVSDGDWAFL